MKELRASVSAHLNLASLRSRRLTTRKLMLALESMERRIVCSAGDLDTTFNQTGKQFLLFPDGASANAAAVESDKGDVVLAGSGGTTSPPFFYGTDQGGPDFEVRV